MVESRFRWKLDPETSEFLRSIATSNRAIMGFGQTSSAQLTRINRGFAAARTAALGFVGALSVRELVRGSNDAVQSLERIRAGLLTATGSTEAANAEFAFLREEADRLGLALRSTAEDYTGLAASARGTALEGENTREIFLGIVEASTALGLSADQTGGALTAVEQIISKGRVSAEELRQQLGERLPGAFQIAARAMNVTTAELDQLLQRGDLTAGEFIPRFAAQLREEFGGPALAAADSLIARMNRLETASFDFLAAVGEGGLADGVSDFADSLTEAADGADSAAETIGTTLGQALSLAGDAVLFLGQNLDVITSLAAGFIATKIVSYILSLVTALRAASVAAGGLTAALAANPVTAFSVAIGAAVGALTLLVQRMEEGDEVAEAFRDRLATIRGGLQDLESDADAAADGLDRVLEGLREFSRQDAMRALESVQDELRATQDELDSIRTLVPADVADELPRLARELNILREEAEAVDPVTRQYLMTVEELAAEEAALAEELNNVSNGLIDGLGPLQRYAELQQRLLELTRERQTIEAIIEDPTVGSTGTPAGDGGGGRTRSSGSRLDRFADTQAGLEAAIEAEQRLQAAAGESNESIERARQQTQLLADIRRIEAQFTGEQRDTLVSLTEELARQAEETDRLMDATETYREAQALVNRLLTEGADSTAVYEQALALLRAEKDANRITAEQLAAAEAALNEEFDRGSDVGEQVGQAVSTAFSDMVTDIENAEAAAARFLQRLAEIILQAAVLGPLEDALSGGADGGGGIGGFFGRIFGGGRAEGGPMRPGLAYRVGERGPETIVPTMPSLVMPAELQQPQSAPAFNVTINTNIDAAGADPAALARVEDRLDNLNQTLPGRVTAIIGGQLRSGGPMAKAAGTRR